MMASDARVNRIHDGTGDGELDVMDLPTSERQAPWQIRAVLANRRARVYWRLRPGVCVTTRGMEEKPLMRGGEVWALELESAKAG
jgi:hypothetical protein